MDKITIDFKLSNIEFVNCFEAVLLSVATWKNREYKLMYKDVWDFKFDLQPEGTPNRLGRSLQTIGYTLHSLIKNLRLFHGIGYASYKCPKFKNLIDILINRLHNTPITIDMDSFYCPWDKSFKRVHNAGHAFIIKGIDCDRKILYCTDPFYNIDDQELRFEDFAEGYTGYYGIFDFSEDNSKNIDVKKLLRELMAGLQERDIFSSIRAFADEINKLGSTSNELEGFEEGWQTPLFWNIRSIVNSRKMMFILLKSLVVDYMYTEFNCILNDFEYIILKWEFIKNSILKLLVPNFNANIKNRIVKLFYEIADIEKTMAKEIK